MSIVIEHKANGQHAVRAICLNAEQAAAMAPKENIVHLPDSVAQGVLLDIQRRRWESQSRFYGRD